MSDDVAPPPPLGVAGRWGPAEIALARRFDDLHQLIYVRGGIRPSNDKLRTQEVVGKNRRQWFEHALLLNWR